MKAITLLTAMIVTFSSCNCQKKAAAASNNVSEETVMKQQTVLPTLEYEANTRGFFRKISVADQVAWVTNVRDGKPEEVKISDADWKELVSLYKSVNKDGLANLKAPTEERFHDGAPMANFRVIEKGKTFESVTFDGGAPPAEIAKIVNKLIEIADKKE
ncbi:hypothetical protein [Flavobacterium humi]|uniref:Uncharacterized protein n=1 Tax=Flavobacterium humi TaxID=2562683 RepID=A0A4Z0L9S7_9FLAO|nr:hypothetical protein [Flavobacterium humi]TGD58571.1 hypothetical protein E4635_06565 [Flavobacterium humi]